MRIPINIVQGYADPDPLDVLGCWQRYALASLVTFGVSAAFLWGVFDVLHIARLSSPWLFWLECGVVAVAYSPIVVALRKASAIVPVALMAATLVPIDIAIEAHIRMTGRVAPWTYEAEGLLGSISPVLRIALVWIGDGIVMGPLCLWLTRVLAATSTKFGQSTNAAAVEELTSDSDATRRLFGDDWTDESVPSPKAGFAFLVLRVIGLAYISYFLLLMLGLFGVAPWPGPIREVLTMSYANSALTINTLIKVTLMAYLATIGAYNVQLRYHTSLVLSIGHGVSVLASLGFFLLADPRAPYRDFLLTSAIVDGVMVTLFAWIMYDHRDLAQHLGKQQEFPDYFSLPRRLTKYFFTTFAIACAAIVVGVLVIRLLRDQTSSWGAVYGFPDPQVSNTLTKYATLSVLAFLIAGREELRNRLLSVLVTAYFVSVLASTSWLWFGDWLSDVRVKTHADVLVRVDWYFALNIAMDGGLVLIFLALRKLYFDVDYGVVALTPTSALDVMSLHEALHPDDRQESGATVRRIDRHIGDIRGRKRGLVNAPFWFLEYATGLLAFLRPPFSTMDREQRLFTLRRYVLRRPEERRRALIPPLADLAYKLGNAAHALVTLAQYSSSQVRGKIGYVPPGARQRLQTSYAETPPNGSAPAPLPRDPEDPANFVPRESLNASPLIAPRVVTPVGEPKVPDDVDYLILGSGAGGAVMAYRLACAVPQPDRILVVDRGPRFSPPSDFSDDEMEMVRRLYKEGGLQQTKRFDLTILQGECVGGSTVVNNACCVEMPAKVRAEWQRDFGLELESLDAEYRRIAEELEIAPLSPNSANPKVSQVFLDSVARYNATQGNAPLVGVTIKTNHRNALGTGLDNIGDRHFRKRSMLETYIPWSEARGVTVASETTAVCLLADGSGRRAEGVLLMSNMGQLQRVRVRKAVVLAGGVIASSHFLMRSGLRANVGQHVACNFALPATLQFETALNAFDGLQITQGVIDAGSRAIFETYFNPPGSFSIALPFYFGRHEELMGNYRRLVNFGALVGSEANGVVKCSADWFFGRPVTWTLGKQDVEHIKFALTTLVAIADAGGAQRIVLPTDPGLDLALVPGAFARFESAIAKYPLALRDLKLVTAHPQGGNRMADAKSKWGATRVVDSDYRVNGWDNVFVCDASLFPSGITVNPQWSIMALSSLAAKSMLTRQS